MTTKTTWKKQHLCNSKVILTIHPKPFSLCLITVWPVTRVTEILYTKLKPLTVHFTVTSVNGSDRWTDRGQCATQLLSGRTAKKRQQTLSQLPSNNSEWQTKFSIIHDTAEDYCEQASVTYLNRVFSSASSGVLTTIWTSASIFSDCTKLKNHLQHQTSANITPYHHISTSF